MTKPTTRLKLTGQDGSLIYDEPFVDDYDAAARFAQEQSDLAFWTLDWSIVDADGEVLESGTAEPGGVP